jgi:hypothetical protein
MELVKSETVQGFRQPMLLHRNLGSGKFEDLSKASGLRDLPVFSSRGAAFGDLNNDGLVDAVITNLGDKPLVLLNTSKNGNQKVSFKLLQNGKNKDAVGARLTLVTDKRTVFQEVQAGSSYISQNDFRLHFGLGSGEKIESVEIRWSDGKTEKVTAVQPNQMVTIRQGKGIAATAAFRE